MLLLKPGTSSNLWRTVQGCVHTTHTLIQECSMQRVLLDRCSFPLRGRQKLMLGLLNLLKVASRFFIFVNFDLSQVRPITIQTLLLPMPAPSLLCPLLHISATLALAPCLLTLSLDAAQLVLPHHQLLQQGLFTALGHFQRDSILLLLCDLIR